MSAPYATSGWAHGIVNLHLVNMLRKRAAQLQLLTVSLLCIISLDVFLSIIVKVRAVLWTVGLDNELEQYCRLGPLKWLALQ